MTIMQTVTTFTQGWKLTKKFLVSILLVLTVVMTVMVIVLSIHQKGVLIEELDKKGKNTAEFLAGIAGEPLLSYNFMYLQNYVRDVARDKEVVYALIEDRQGKSLASYAEKTKGGEADRASEEILEVTAPILMNKDQIGMIRIGYSTDNINKSLHEARMIVIGLSAGMMMAISLVVYLLFREIALKPIESLHVALSRVASGDLSHTMDVTTKDEIGDLGRAANKMSQDLKGLMESVYQTATQTGTSSEQIATGSHSVQEGAIATSQATEETLVSVQEMVVLNKGVAENAGEMSQSATDASSSASEMASSIEEVSRNAGVLAAAVEDTASSVEEMIASIKQVSENTDALSASAEETSSSITEMSSTIKEVEQRAVESTSLAEQVSRDASERGMTAAKEAIEGMQNIKATVEASATVVNRLGKRSHEIGQVLKVIDEVTDQTGLLALNAAILAAQAGEHGKGFTVVAEEIKDLAERTAASTQEIAGLIATVREETAESVQAMDKGLKAVESGVALVNVTSEVLEQVTNSSKQSADMARAIEKTTAEQARGVAQITETSLSITDQLEQIAGALQEQRKGSERIVKASERMREITRQVRTATQEQTTGSRQIANALEAMTGQATRVARSTEEQSLGAQQVSEAISRIQKITEETVNVSTEMDKAVQMLKQKAEVLQGELGHFKV
jgi:methyl-accepting chemotaxis protein